MPTQQAIHPAGLPHRERRKHLEQVYCEIVRDTYRAIDQAGLNDFTVTFIEGLWSDLNAIVQHLERLPEAAFKELIQVIEVLSKARDELRLARFLFDVEEIDPIRRLVMRNRAVMRGGGILHRAIRVWPYYNPPHD